MHCLKARQHDLKVLRYWIIVLAGKFTCFKFFLKSNCTINAISVREITFSLHRLSMFYILTLQSPLWPSFFNLHHLYLIFFILREFKNPVHELETCISRDCVDKTQIPKCWPQLIGVSPLESQWRTYCHAHSVLIASLRLNKDLARAVRGWCCDIGNWTFWK